MGERIRYIKEFYQRDDEKIDALLKRPYIYLSQAEMDEFVQKTTAILTEIFEYIWIQKNEVPFTGSILEKFYTIDK